MDKRGQGLSTSAIILIVLGIFVLVILILGFTLGWGKLNPFIPSNNVNALKDACALACTQDSVVDFCTVNREFNMKKDNPTDLKSGEKYTCARLSDFSLELGIEPCPSLCKSCKAFGGEIKPSTEACTEILEARGLNAEEKCCQVSQPADNPAVGN